MLPFSLERFHVKQEIPGELVEVFEAQLASWNIFLELERLEALALYVEELAAYERANVVGTREVGRLWLDHVLDSLSCLLYEPLKEASSLVDVGSGGGLPGIPLHLAVGFQRVCLLESTGKKTEFLDHVSSRLKLAEVEVANYRAEELGRDSGYRESFEAATVRAVAPLEVISEYCMPLLAPGGAMTAMKGRIEAEERRAGERGAKMLGGELAEVIRVPFTPELEQKERHLVVVKKLRTTPERYPRQPGTPKKSPLGSEK